MHHSMTNSNVMKSNERLFLKKGQKKSVEKYSSGNDCVQMRQQTAHSTGKWE